MLISTINCCSALVIQTLISAAKQSPIQSKMSPSLVDISSKIPQSAILCAHFGVLGGHRHNSWC